MNKFKTFCKEHEKEIYFIGGVTIAVVVGTILIKRSGRTMIDITGKQAITWPNEDKTFMNLERVKEILELNKNNSSKFAIFREGSDPEKYVAIVMSDGFIG